MVKKLLEGLKTTTSPGPDGFHPRILKEASFQVAKPLTILFQKSLNTDILPNEWKLGTVVPIFKKGKRQDPGNYHSVSLTAVPCKLIETLIRDCLMTHLMTEGLLHSEQHGFRPRKPCSSQIFEVLKDWSLGYVTNCSARCPHDFMLIICGNKMASVIFHLTQPPSRPERKGLN